MLGHRKPHAFPWPHVNGLFLALFVNVLVVLLSPAIAWPIK